MLKQSFVLAVAVAATASARFGYAVDYVWNGSDFANNTNWSNPLNWTANSGSPSAAADRATFDATGIAQPANAIDSSTTIIQLLYRQNAGEIYTTSIDRGATLTLTGLTGNNITTIPVSSLVVMPSIDTTGGSTGAQVIFKSTGTGALGNLSITSGDVLISGRPGTSNTNSSYAIVDMRQLDSFTYQQAGNSVFGVGTGNGSNSDNGAYWGQLFLATTSTITVNRLAVGGQNNAGSQGAQPVSTMLLGQTTNINLTFQGNTYVGGDPGSPAKDGSGAILFQAGLTNPVLNLGAPSFANGLEIGRHRAGTGHSVFGVVDTTSASGTSDGTFNGEFATITISAQSNGTAAAGGGFGMLSMDKGTVNSTNIVVARTASAPTAGTDNVGVLNVGVRGSAADAGGGVLNVNTTVTAGTGTLSLGQRGDASSGGALYSILNLANSGTINADRVFVGNNTQPSGSQTVTAILNLGGGTLTTSQVKAGSDTAQAGTTTRLVNFNGGTLQVKTGASQANRDTFLEGHTVANIYSGGATFDTNGQDITINQVLAAPAGDGVQTISITDGGSGYRVAPIVLITGGGGIGATAVARIDSSGAVIGLDVTNPGTGYTSAPTISLYANAGTSTTNMKTPYGGVAATVTANTGANISGGITKIGGGTLTLTAANTYTGATILNNGVLLANNTLGSATGTGPVTLTGGTLGGNGIIAGTVTAGATAHTIAPSAGLTPPVTTTLTVGGLTASANTTLAFNLTAAGGADKIVVTGANALTLNGAHITVANTATGLTSLGWHNIIQYNGLAVPITGLTTPAGSGNIAYQLDTSSSNLVRLHRGFLGDANDDGNVNFDDFLILSQNFGQAGNWNQANFLGSPTVDFNNFLVLSQHFGQSITGSELSVTPDEIAQFQAASQSFFAGNGVPEPTSLALLGLGAAACLTRRRRTLR